eukprot:6309163-Pyramimonas_sp.AAC.1
MGRRGMLLRGLPWGLMRRCSLDDSDGVGESGHGEHVVDDDGDATGEDEGEKEYLLHVSLRAPIRAQGSVE